MSLGNGSYNCGVTRHKHLIWGKIQKTTQRQLIDMKDDSNSVHVNITHQKSTKNTLELDFRG